MPWIPVYGDKEIWLCDVRFRITELSEWVAAFIEQGNAREAGFWAYEACRISQALPEYPFITE